MNRKAERHFKNIWNDLVRLSEVAATSSALRLKVLGLAQRWHLHSVKICHLACVHMT